MEKKMIKTTLASSKVEISPDKIHCVIFDMDGVVTKTADVHSIAWKKMFDDFLEKSAKKNKTSFISFDLKKDYNKYVDGKPRIEGIQSFLSSRGIELLLGNPDDHSEIETIHGLGNKKNRFFIDHIEKYGIEPFETSVDLINELKKNGIKVAIVTSSKNCKSVLESAGILDLFEARIDGLYSELHGIKGKPEPDIFLEAAKQLGVDPKYCVAIEDAISGVQACSRAGFACVIGVDRVGHEEDLYQNGADVVVKDLSEVCVIPRNKKKDALESIEEIKDLIQNKRIVFFLDYDGTLSPIADRPELAFLPEETRKTLERLSKKFIVSIVSGRDLFDVKSFVGIDGLYYAGSHGYDITGPYQDFQISEAERFINVINLAEAELQEKLHSIEGVIIERKKFGVAVHYRLVEEENFDALKMIVEEVHNKHLELRKTSGKKVFELQPKIDWHKGKALLWLLECLGLDREDVISFYIGDDVTDEDAFKVIAEKGIGISVQENVKPTFAKYTLKNPKSVQQFLEKFVN